MSLLLIAENFFLDFFIWFIIWATRNKHRDIIIIFLIFRNSLLKCRLLISQIQFPLIVDFRNILHWLLWNRSFHLYRFLSSIEIVVFSLRWLLWLRLLQFDKSILFEMAVVGCWDGKKLRVFVLVGNHIVGEFLLSEVGWGGVYSNLLRFWTDHIFIFLTVLLLWLIVLSPGFYDWRLVKVLIWCLFIHGFKLAIPRSWTFPRWWIVWRLLRKRRSWPRHRLVAILHRKLLLNLESLSLNLKSNCRLSCIIRFLHIHDGYRRLHLPLLDRSYNRFRWLFLDWFDHWRGNHLVSELILWLLVSDVHLRGLLWLFYIYHLVVII